MQIRSAVSGETLIGPVGLGLWARLLVLDVAVLTLQTTVMSHLQTPLFTCHLAPLVAILIGMRQGPAVGGGHGLLLGWASGALLVEPTGIPILIVWALGMTAGFSRDAFQIEHSGIRIGVTFALILVGEVLTTLLQLAVWQRLVFPLPLSLLIYVILAGPADFLIERVLPLH